MAPSKARYSIALLLLLSNSSTAAEVCLSKQEARKLWPRQHIYWYSKNHCWSNRRGKPPSDIKLDPIIDAPAKRARAEMIGTRNYLHPLDANANLDFPFEDYCCWPPLRSLIPDLSSHIG